MYSQCGNFVDASIRLRPPTSRTLAYVETVGVCEELYKEWEISETATESVAC
jgi:hypothetical protein